MNEKEFLDNLGKQFDEFIGFLKNEFNVIRANRPSSALVEDIKVDCYGQSLTIKQLGSINTFPPREIRIQLWDKEIIKNVLKSLEASNRGFSASAEGNLIKVFLPELSQERRQELKKIVKRISEDFKIKIRHLRDEANKRIQDFFEKNEISEDQKFKLKEKVQKKVEEVNKNLDELLNSKIREINV